jgi:hypothetical protein
MLMGAIVIHAAQMMNQILYEDLPDYGFKPEDELLLHTTACFLFWPHALYRALQGRRP